MNRLHIDPMTDDRYRLILLLGIGHKTSERGTLRIYHFCSG